MNAFYDYIRTMFQELALAGMLPESFQYAFVVNSLLCAMFIGPVLGGIGTMVVIKRLAFFSEAVGHAALTGVALGILLGEPSSSPYASMFGFCILFGLIMSFTKNRTKMSSDTLIAVFLSISLAAGASLLLYVTRKVNVHILDNILFGSILTVNDTDMNVLMMIVLLCLAVGLPYYNKMLLASFNPYLARARGVNVKLLDYVFIVMITALTVASVKIIGAMLVEALLIIPAAAARNLSRSIRGLFLYSMIFSTLSCLVGIIVPLEYDIPIPSGGAIILVAAAFFVATTTIKTVAKGFSEAG